MRFTHPTMSPWVEASHHQELVDANERSFTSTAGACPSCSLVAICGEEFRKLQRDSKNVWGLVAGGTRFRVFAFKIVTAKPSRSVVQNMH